MIENDHEEWIHRFESELSMATKKHREAVSAVIVRIKELAPNLLAKTRLSNDRAFSSVAKPLSLKSETATELEVTELVLRGVYDFHCDLRPTLIPPRSFSPLTSSMPLINELTMPVGVVDYLLSRLYGVQHQRGEITQEFRDETFNNSTRELGRALVIVAYRTGLTRVAELDSLLSIPVNDYLLLNDQELISVFLPMLHRRVYLSNEAILAMHYLSSHKERLGKTSQTRLKKIQNAISDWLSHTAATCKNTLCRKYLNTINVSHLLKNIGLLDNLIGLQSEWMDNYAVDDAALIGAFTGHIANDSSDVHINPQSTFFGDTKLETAKVTTKKQQSALKDQEAEAHRLLRRVISDYYEVDKKEKRTSKAYHSAKESLIQLAELPLAWSSALTINWITSLFIYGSPWKDKLAAQSLLTYHSTLNSFAQAAWSNIDLNDITLSEFETACQVGIDHFEQAGQQYTVARFLRYCQQFSSFPDIDLDIFETLSDGGRVRAHYIPPAMFDKACEYYCKGKGHNERKIVLFMQLCYYAGLREDEALSLKCRDIDFETGMLYITDEKKRKTPHAVRQIPLSLLPESLLRSVADEVAERYQRNPGTPQHEVDLFLDWSYELLESQFIAFLRDFIHSPDIVTHSLRHCAAMNWVVILAMMAFGLEIALSYYFLQHEIFSNKQQQRIRNSFELNGHGLTPYFPILEWVSEKIGHSGPSITFAVYLHMIDWLSFVMTNRTRPIAKSLVRHWVSSNSYAFERQKQLFAEENMYKLVGELDSRSVMALAPRLFKGAKYFKMITDAPQKSGVVVYSPVLVFSDFIDEINKKRQGVDDAFCDAQFAAWLDSTKCTPVALMLNPAQEHAWLRLSQSIDKWPAMPHTKLLAFQSAFQCLIRFIESGESITVLQDLQHIVRAYQAMNLHSLMIKLQGRVGSKSVLHWCEWLAHQGIEPELVPTEAKTSASLRPYRLNWVLWKDLKAIARLILAYLDYLLNLEVPLSSKSE